MQLCQDCGRYHLNIQSCKATLTPYLLSTKPAEEQEMTETIKCPECTTMSTVKFQSLGAVFSYCPACGTDISCEPTEEEEEDTGEE